MKLIRLVGMMLIVFIREKLKSKLSNVLSATVGTGIMGTMVTQLCSCSLLHQSTSYEQMYMYK